ncbi:DUF4229 domain-containing protein [Serinicoccus chungangensis]|uniref:DUF4229 domain-containing protein n=1 Tax=Serinicoccus chungangensis TaxID=767452 RepID=UPI001930E5C1|nr:DUF4229 domain-containing protein [Serinicoccus chungangensis]
MIVARYTAMRLLVFIGFFALGRLLTLGVLWSAVLAAVASMVVSYFLLAPDRERLAAGLERRVEDRMERRRAKIDDERVDEED